MNSDAYVLLGLTAIVGALAVRIAAGDVPQNLATLSILELETGQLVAGAKLRGEIEERLKQVVSAIKAKDTILFIANIESLLGQGASGSGVGDLLKPMLTRGPRPTSGKMSEMVSRRSSRSPTLSWS